MAKLTIDDLIYPLTREQVQSYAYQILGRLGVTTTSWKPGAVVRTMIVAMSAIYAGYTDLMAELARSGFLELSSGEWLTLVARYTYGVERIPASYASGLVTVTNSGGGLYTFDPGDLIVAHQATGATYRNQTTIELGPTGSPTATVQGTFTATVAGSVSSALAGDINRVVVGIPQLSCTNPTAITGFDQEGDAALRQRCAETLGALSPMGPWDAYSTALRNAKRADGSLIGITRVGLSADGYGHVDCYAATDQGGITGDMSDPNTDVGAAMLAVLKNAAPQSVTPRVHGADNIAVAVNYTISAYNTLGLTIGQIELTLANALAAFFPRQPVGGNRPTTAPSTVGYVYREGMAHAMMAAIPEIFHVQFATPAADIELGANQVAILGPVTADQINLVPPPEAYHP